MRLSSGWLWLLFLFLFLFLVIKAVLLCLEPTDNMRACMILCKGDEEESLMLVLKSTLAATTKQQHKQTVPFNMISCCHRQQTLIKSLPPPSSTNTSCTTPNNIKSGSFATSSLKRIFSFKKVQTQRTTTTKMPSRQKIVTILIKLTTTRMTGSTEDV